MSLSGSRGIVKSDMLPPPDLEKPSWESAPAIVQQGDIERGQLEVRASSYPEGVNDKNEYGGANPPPTSSKNSKVETDGDVPYELDSEFIVWWDGPDDLENPMNWSSTWKWVNICVISVISFLVWVH